MKLEDITLSEISRTQKDKYCRTPVLSSQTPTDRRENGGYQGLGREIGS